MSAALNEALKNCKLMFSFVTPHSMNTPWLYYESGYAHSAEVHVVPVGLGADITKIGPPLGLLQGFNITSAEHLNNLLLKANETFHHKHKLAFTEADYAALFTKGTPEATGFLGRYSDLVDSVDLEITVENGGHAPLMAFLEKQTNFTTLGPRQQDHTHLIEGARVRLSANGPQQVRFMVEIDPLIAPELMPKLEKGIREALGKPADAAAEYMCSVTFRGEVDFEAVPHKLMARLAGTGTETDKALTKATSSQLWLRRQALAFFFQGRRIGSPGKIERVTTLHMKSYAPTFEAAGLGELLNVLFDTKALVAAD